MILKKTIINDKAFYEEISYEEALAYQNKEELIFSSEDEKDDFFDQIEEQEELAEMLEDLIDKATDLTYEIKGLSEEKRIIYEQILNEILSKLEDSKSNKLSDLEDILDEIEEKLDNIEDEIDDLLDEDDDDDTIKIKLNGKNFNFGKDFGNMFAKAFTGAFNGKNSKANKLIAALPFMTKEDIHELVDNILNNEEDYKDLSLVAVMPFLDSNDCDRLFMKFVIEGENEKFPIVALAPFVSKQCLSSLVDEYINGKYQNIEMSTLYPFLDSNDVKRVFNYILSKKE